MKKTLKKVFTSLLAFAMMFGTFTLPVSADTVETTAYLSFADNGWAVQYWFDGNDYSPVVANNATVTGYGTYTVSLDFSGVEGGAPDIAFFDVEIKDGENLFPNSYMNIDSVKINGEEVAVGTTYTSSDNQIDTRTNLYNTWVSDATTVDNARTADGSAEGITAAPIAGADYKNITSVEVTFTLQEGKLCNNGSTPPAPLKELPAEGTTAYLSSADNGWAVQYWFDGNDYAPVVANNATVTGPGQYTVSLDFTGVEGGVSPDFAFLDVEIKGGEEYFPQSYMTIDSVKINGEEVALTGKTYTSSDNQVDTRTNLYNTWIADATTVENARTADGSADGITAAPLDLSATTNVSTVEVTFTLGDGILCNAQPEAEGAAFDPNGTYHAYLGVQTPTWIFRNAWDDASYGKETEYFGQLGIVDNATSSWVALGGTFTDAEINGNGTYTVSLTGYDFSGTYADQAILGADGLFNLLFVSTDLPVGDAVTISNVVLKMDGKEISTQADPFLDGDVKDYKKILFANIWNTEVPALPFYAAPATSIEVSFDVSGFANDKVAEEAPVETPVETPESTTDPAPEATPESPVESAPADDAADTTAPAEEGGNNTMVIIIVVVAVVVVAAVAGVVVAKKKKAK